MNTLVVCEKPSVAKSIASVLGATHKGDGFYEGNNYIVVWCFGHMYNLYDVKDYDDSITSWNLKDFPFIPKEYKYKEIDDSRIKKQISIIKAKGSICNGIINGIDADREGELIFQEVKRGIGLNKPIKRLWLTSHTPKDVIQGFNALQSENEGLIGAGFARQWIDWLLGINLTVLFTKKTGSSTALKVGRVILPTLKLIYDREMSIKAFDSKNFYKLHGAFDFKGQSYTGVYVNAEGNDAFDNVEVLKSLQDNMTINVGTIQDLTVKQTKNSPSKLFSLTDLQRHITKQYKGFTADKVLDIAQTLYEKHKVTTYPRTASRYLNQTQIDAVKEVFEIHKGNMAFDFTFHTNKSIFNDAKVDGHHAIIPTYLLPKSLNEDEQIVYDEIVKRFMSQFLPYAIYEEISFSTNVGEHLFKTKGKRLVQEGFLTLYAIDRTKELTISSLQNNETASLINLEIKEGSTHPPKHYTEDALLGAMENCGKSVEDEEAILKGFSIGTVATRASTINKMINANYINRNGKSFVITQLGIDVIESFPIKSMLSVDFTGKIEKSLKEIETGELSLEDFMGKMTAFSHNQMTLMKKDKSIKSLREKSDNYICKCPYCGNDFKENSKAFSCQGTYDHSCDLTLWKNDKYLKAWGITLTKKDAKALVEKGVLKKTKVKTKKGIANLLIKLKKNGAYWNYDIKFTK